MRTIKFRGKRIDNGKWIYGYLADVDKTSIGNIGIINSRPFSGVEESSMVNADTIGQFTGVLDQRGNEIYEGDIIKTKFIKNGKSDERKSEVSFCYSEFRCDYEPELKVPLGGIARCAEVIGNIHDNPELLKGGAQ